MENKEFQFNPESKNMELSSVIKLNKALVSYISSVVPKPISPLYGSTTQWLPLETKFIKSVIVYINYLWIGDVSETREGPFYGIKVEYREEIPERVLAFKDKEGNLSIGGEREYSTFEFTENGGGNFDQGVYEYYNPADYPEAKSIYTGLEDETYKRKYQYILEDKDLAERMVYVPKNPNDKPYLSEDLGFGRTVFPSSFYENYIKPRIKWYELISYVLYELNRQYPDRFPDFREFEQEFNRNINNL